MLIVTLAALLVWGLLRRFGKQYSLVIFLIASLITSFIVISDLWTAGVFREEISPDYGIIVSTMIWITF
ncbi:MAG: hypothetical protein ACXACG_10890 [Candidatus Thorarchaeota archaeon]|jgi:hypothetical protein